MKRIKLSDAAEAYVRAEAAYLGARSRSAAAKFRILLSGLKRNLADFPALGHANTETAVEGIFRFVMDEYLVDYEVSGEVVNIIAIRHGRQAPPNQPPDSDDDYEAT
ncbi:MAG: type II toxin-antitoxin system RelE/ParE family toxin [Rhizobium sp.]|nr:type II toxin-antitoxin system RelE/ParE family toxin [Rhizobium sp.]